MSPSDPRELAAGEDGTGVEDEVGFGLEGTQAFEVGYLGSDGVAALSPLRLAWNLPFEGFPQVRKFPSRKGQPNFPGPWWFATTGQFVAFESWVKRDVVMALDYDQKVTGLACEPLRLHWPGCGARGGYIPHYFARLADGTGQVIDVRARAPKRRAGAAAEQAVRAACAQAGWSYRRLEPLDRGLARNLRWLHRYAHPRNDSAAIAGALCAVFATPTPLFAGAGRVGETLAVLPRLYHLMWQQVLTADLQAGPLGRDTLVRPGPRYRQEGPA